jgi:hypothetical protein
MRSSTGCCLGNFPPQIIYYVRRVFVIESPNLLGDDFLHG